MPAEAVKLIESSAAQRAPSGVEAEAEAISDDNAWLVAKTRASGIIDSSIRRWAQGDRQKDWHWSGSIYSEGSLLLYVQVYGYLIQYNGRKYVFWTNTSGQLADIKLPRCKRKIATVAGGIALAMLFEWLTAFNGGLLEFVLCSAFWGGSAYGWKWLLEDRWRRAMG